MGNKKIILSMPESLLYEADKFASAEDVTRSQWIREAIKCRILEEQKRETENALKQGYVDMAKINLCIAEEGIKADNEQLLTYEQKLSESE